MPEDTPVRYRILDDGQATPDVAIARSLRHRETVRARVRADR